MRIRTCHAVRRLVLLASAWVILCATPLTANPLQDLEAVHPSPSAQRFFYGGGQWIGLRGDPQVSGDGEITHSADGLTWSKSKIPPDFRPIHAAYNNGLWVVTGQEGIHGINLFSAILTSTDGIVWEQQNPNMDLWRLQNVNPWLRRVDYGNGLWMAMGSTGRYLTSTNGVNWTTRAISGASNVYSVSYGNGRWLALSGHGWTFGPAYISTNGIDWTAHDLPMWIASVSFGDGQWAAIVHDVIVNSIRTSIRTSTDGIEWVTREIIERPLYSAEAQAFQIAYGGGAWLVAGTERTGSSEQGPWRSLILTSSDGLTWQRTTIPTSPIIEQIAAYISVNHGNGLWLLNGRHYYGNSELLSSTDALNWTPRTERVGPGFNDLAYGAGQWTAVGALPDESGFIATSFDGRKWVRAHVMGGGNLTAVAYGDGRWMAAGYQLHGSPESQFTSGIVLTATNGSEWVPTLKVNVGSLRGVAHGNGLWVAVGLEAVNDAAIPVLATSPNGLDWTKQTMLSSGWIVLDKVGFADGRWIVLGVRRNGSQEELAMMTSTDGIHWSNVEGITAHHQWGNMYFADGLWMIPTYRKRPDAFAFDPPTTLRSTNGTDWLTRDLDVEFQSYGWFSTVIHVAGKWIISGGVSRGSQSHSALWVSEDGEQWTEHLIGLKQGRPASDGKRLIIAGEHIWVSERLTPLLAPILSLAREGSNVSLWLSGENGERYDIEQTLNLTPPDWAHLQSVILTNASQSVLPGLPAEGQGFYRARTP